MFVRPIMTFYWLVLSCEMFYKSDYLFLIFYVESNKKRGDDETRFVQFQLGVHDLLVFVKKFHVVFDIKTDESHVEFHYKTP